MLKPQKTQGHMGTLLATYRGPKPGDFPLGSAESRAAARAMLDETRKLSPYEKDCLLISQSETWLTSGTDPNWRDLEDTPFYKRGRELEDALYGPIIPYHLDTKAQRQTWASIAFERIHRREPIAGETLRYEEVEKALPAARYKVFFKACGEAWERRLPNLTFPFRFEDGKLFRRVRNDGRTITWEEETDIQPRWKWYGIEADAVGGWQAAPKPPDPPGVRAVVFVESPDMKHATKPLSPATP